MSAIAEEKYDLVVIGGGPAGLAAACAAWDKGVRSILLVEREKELGGILNQCIHNGFGLHRFKEELTGPEYAARYVKELRRTGVVVALDTMVLELTPDKKLHLMSKAEGYRIVSARAVVLAMGCRERTRGAIGIPGTRPAGIFNAGDAQRYVNIDGYMVGRRVLILGSGDIGLIMARRMTLEGAEVLACVELMPYSGGLNRNIVQCLHDFDIPLYLSHTITEIRGERRVEGVTVSQVDNRGKPIPGTEKVFDCDTILLSVGLIPENELSRQAGIGIDQRTRGPEVSEDMQTSIPGVFACGNVVHVHDLVDFVSAESARAGEAAGKFILDNASDGSGGVPLCCGEGISYSVPQKLHPERVGGSVDVFFRVRRPYGKSAVRVASGGKTIAAFKRDHLMPGEMEHIALPGKLLASAGEQIDLWIEESGS